MPLHDVVGINRKNGATTETQAQVSSICTKRCILMIVCVCYLTCSIQFVAPFTSLLVLDISLFLYVEG